MEVVCSPEISAHSHLAAEAYDAQKAHLNAVSCRKYLMRLIACHPGRAAQIIISGIDVLEKDEPVETSAYVRIQSRAQKVREAKSHSGKIEGIVEAVAEKYGFTAGDIYSCRRTADVVLARHLAFYLSKVLTRQSLPVIGQHCGDKDHTTVLHGIRNIEAKIATDEKFAEEISSLLATLSQKEAA